ncbi:MAG: hypothetical protein ISR58_21455, partial [Anaerolineales bacterium]|nr:hypothetical protein [Anaerolineales bacterium]
MNLKRTFWLLSFLLVASLIFSACGGGAAEEAPAPVEEAEAGETMEAVTLRWRTRPDNQEEADVYQGISDSLNLEGITLEYEPGGSETSSYQDVLKTEL